MGTEPGAFGKIPSLGDFFRIRAGAEFVAVWDGWLQEVMLNARQVLGPRYEACYMSAPVWRFVLPAGVAGPSGLIGVLMPSVDRVGRQFPLTLMAELPAGADRSPFRTCFAQSATLDALEDLALDALDDAMTRDALDARLAAITPAAESVRGHLLRGLAGSIVMQGSDPALLAADLAEAALAPGRSAVWCCTVDGASRFFTTAGLPRGADAIALFDLDAAFWAESPA